MTKKDFEIDRDSRLYPELLRQIPNPPKKLFAEETRNCWNIERWRWWDLAAIPCTESRLR